MVGCWVDVVGGWDWRKEREEDVHVSVFVGAVEEEVVVGEVFVVVSCVFVMVGCSVDVVGGWGWRKKGVEDVHVCVFVGEVKEEVDVGEVVVKDGWSADVVDGCWWTRRVEAARAGVDLVVFVAMDTGC